MVPGGVANSHAPATRPTLEHRTGDAQKKQNTMATPWVPSSFSKEVKKGA